MLETAAGTPIPHVKTRRIISEKNNFAIWPNGYDDDLRCSVVDHGRSGIGGNCRDHAALDG